MSYDKKYLYKLTFPIVPNNGYNKKPIEYWRELGLLENESNVS